MCPPIQTSPNMSDQEKNAPTQTRKRTISITEIVDNDQEMNIPTRTRKRTISTTEIVDKKLSNVIRRLSAPINILIEEIPDSATQHEVVQKYTQVFTYLFASFKDRGSSGSAVFGFPGNLTVGKTALIGDRISTKVPSILIFRKFQFLKMKK